MKEQDYTASIVVKLSAAEAFNGLNNVAAWWNEFEGSTTGVNEEFTVTFGDIHRSTQKVTEMYPNKRVTWLVTDSQLNFVEKKDEWTGTTIRFDMMEKGGMTEIRLTHIGLQPSIQCYDGCSKGWDYWFKGSLYKFLTEGKGTPGL